MDIIFQSGEFTNSESEVWKILELLMSLIGILLGAGAAILVFRLGQKVERQKEGNRLKDLSEYLKHSISDLRPPLEKQISSLKYFAGELMEKYDKDFAPQHIVSLHSRNIKWINPNDIYRIFVINRDGSRKLHTELLRNFNSDLDYIDAIGGTLKDTFSLFRSKYDQYIENWNANLNALTNIKDELMIEFITQRRANAQALPGPFLSGLQEIFHAWLQIQDNMEHVNVIDFLITPLDTLARNNLLEPKAILILNYNRECKFAYTNVLAVKTFTKDSIVFAARKLRRVERNIAQYTSGLNKFDLKEK